MATDQVRKPRRSDLTAEQDARLEAMRARNRTPEARTEEARVRDGLAPNARRPELLRQTATARRWATRWPSDASSCLCAASAND